MGNQISRRSLLRQMIWLSSIAAINPIFFSSCKSEGKKNAPSLDNGIIDIEPFASIEQLRNYLRLSPDHLVARAASMVEEQDIKGLFLLIRDEIMTYPDTGGYQVFSTNSLSSNRWGSRATLRGGAGTLREKADLLVKLFTKAGFEAKVMSLPYELSEKEQKQILFRKVEREFDPPFPSQLKKKMSSDEMADVPHIDFGGKESEALAKKLMATLPKDYKERIKTLPIKKVKATIPCVHLVDSEKEYFFNLIDFETTFENIANTPPEKAHEPYYSPEVLSTKIILKGVYSDDPKEEITLLENDVPINELAGRQLVLSFLTGLPLQQMFQTSINDIYTFTPVCHLQGMDLDEETAAEFSRQGQTLTLFGDEIEITEDNQLKVNGLDFGVAGQKSAKANLVSSLEAKAYSNSFPTVKVRLKAFDKKGNPIEGLMPNDFQIEEDGKPIQAFLQSNHFAPSIAILRDYSGSIPSEYLGDKWTELLGRIKESIHGKFPQARISVIQTSDRYWEELNNAADDDWNMIICVSDGELTDQFKPKYKTKLESLPPVVFSYITEEEHPHLKELAEYIDITPIQANDKKKLDERIIAALPEKIIPPYTFQYEALESGNSTRKLKITINKTSTSATFQIPENNQNPARQLCGLSMYIDTRKGSHRHHLGGFDLKLEDDVTREHLKEAKSVLLGNTFLFVEGARPTESVWLDDIWSAKLSFLETFQACSREESIQKIEEKLALTKSIPSIPFLALAPLDNPVSDSHLTFEQSCRMCVYQQYPEFGKETFKSKVNVLGAAGYNTIADNPKKAFQLTLENTARIAISEAALFGKSTYGLLQNKSLTNLKNIYSHPEKFPEISSDTQFKWYQLIGTTLGSYDKYAIGPKDGSHLSFFQIHKKTGEVLAILDDGSGGGAEETRIKKILQELDRAIAAINLMIAGIQAGGMLTGGSAAALGVVAVYGQYLARLYACVALAISYMDTGQLDERIRATLSRMICDMVKGLAYGIFKPSLANFENIVSSGGGSLPSPCDLITPKPDFEQ